MKQDIIDSSKDTDAIKGLDCSHQNIKFMTLTPATAI